MKKRQVVTRTAGIILMAGVLLGTGDRLQAAECEVAASVAMASVVPLVRQSHRVECSPQLLGAFDGSLQ